MYKQQRQYIFNGIFFIIEGQHHWYHTTASSLALNGGGRIFFTPRPLPYFPCLLSCLVLSRIYWETLCTALQTENYGFDQLVSQRNWHHLLDEKLGFGGTWLPWRNVRSWLHDGRVWRIVCLAALSVEDIEDIYLFGTMITGLLLIGLGFALGYRRIQKTGTAVQSLTRLPVMIEAVGRAVSIETETINRNMDSIMEKLTALQRKIDGIGDQNGQRE